MEEILQTEKLRKEYLFDSTDQLKKIIMEHRKGIFTDREVDGELLKFICDEFAKIDDPFLFEGTIVGHKILDGKRGRFTFKTIDSDSQESPEKTKAIKKQRDCLDKFILLFFKHFLIDIPYISEHISSGGFGAIYDTNNGDDGKKQVVKYIFTDQDKSFYLKSDANLRDINEYMWMVEFCSYVIVMSILNHIDHELIRNPRLCDACVTGNNYNSFVAKIAKPIMCATVHQTIVDNKNVFETKYIVGYIMKKYTHTVDFIFKEAEEDEAKPEKIHNAFDVMHQIFDMLKKFTYLTNLGIIVSHRDVSTKNIMCYPEIVNGKEKYKIKLIDFGFLCTSIKFNNGTSLAIGTNGGKNINNAAKCDKLYVDIILFIAWCLKFHKKLFDKFSKLMGDQNIAEQFFGIIAPNKEIKENFEKYVNVEKSDPWKYSLEYDLLIHNSGLTSENIFTDSFKILENIRKKLSIYNKMEGGGLETFLETYKENKLKYLKIV